MNFSQTERCPETFRDWSDRARAKCTKRNHLYHCVHDEFSRTVEVCIASIWIEQGYCPVYNTNAKKMDSTKCSGPHCPPLVYKSDDVYKYDSCQQSFSSTTQNTIQTTQDTISPTTSTNGAVIAVPVIGILVVAVLSIVGVILWRRKGKKGFQTCLHMKGKTSKGNESENKTENGLPTCLQGRGTNPKESEPENTTENEPLYPRHEDNLQINNENTTAPGRTPPNEFFVDDTLISRFLLILRDHQTLVLFRKWGSGKRTLAKQISSKLAKEEGLKIRFVRHLISIPRDLASMGSTVLIMEDPFKPQYTDRHNAEIFDCLLNLRATAKQNQNFLLILFHCDAMTVTEKVCLDPIGKKINQLFPETLVSRISFSKETLTKIAQSEEENISSEDIKQIAENDKSSGMGQTLTLTLFLKNPFYRHKDFLKDPITFVLEKLREMATSETMNERVQFTKLVHMILDGKEITKSEVEAMVDQDVSDNSDKVNLTTECILQRYVEETIDGKSYRLVHDVITRCILYTALKHDIQRNLVYKECDSLLLLSCFRHKTITERIIYPKEFIFDNQTFDIGIPTESIPSLAETFGQRNDMMTMLRNARLCEDREFQNKLLKVCQNYKNVQNMHDV